MSAIYKIPFLRFLLPFVVGILLQYYFFINKWSIIIISLGIIMMLFSFFIPKQKQFRYRWLFGFGLYLVLTSFGIFLTWIKQYQNIFPFNDANQVYTGYISNIPKNKPNTIAIELQLDKYDRKIVCYLPKDSLSSTLEPGNRISFIAKIQPFEKVGKIGNFDYANYMYNKGFCGYAFLIEDLWEKHEDTIRSLTIEASKLRGKIIEFYRSLRLNNNQQALLSALTLGYTTDLSDNIVQDFRNSGVAHILAVSGLHISIIYLVILSFLKSLPNRKAKQIVVILLLWLYIFIVGLPPSAVRAGIMLTLFCIAIMLNRKSYSYNSIFVAAFLILVWNPLLFFDVGFQLSFVAVLSIKIFMPLLIQIFKFKNKLLRNISNLLSLSFAAQLGVLPLSLYYFGVFPSYFLLTNLLIMPVIAIVIYFTLAIFISGLIQLLDESLYLNIINLFIYCIHSLLDYIILITHFFSKLPCSSIQNINISLISLLLVTVLISFTFFLIKRFTIRNLTSVVICSLFILIVSLYERYRNQNTLIVYKTPSEIKLAYQKGIDRVVISNVTKNEIFSLQKQNLLLLVDDTYRNKESVKNRMKIDFLCIETDKLISLTELLTLFDVKKVVLGNCMSQKSIKRLIQECEKMRIPYYDIYAKGNLTINF